MAEVKYIVYSLGDQKYSMNLSNINGIEQTYNIVTIPLGAAYIKGIIHLREEVIPVYDLKARFGIEDQSSDLPNEQMIIAETHGIKLGICVDEVLGIVSLEEDDIKKVPKVVRNEDTRYLDSVVKVSLTPDQEPEIILSISVDRIMSDSEFEDVSNALEDVADTE